MSRVNLHDLVYIECGEELSIVSCLSDFPDGSQKATLIGFRLNQCVDTSRLTVLGTATPEEIQAARLKQLNDGYGEYGR